MTKECILYKQINNHELMCTCCNHFCKVKNNDFGICGVRQNINGKLYLNVYSRAFGTNIDPIEKKPLYHFYPGESIFSFGTAGCNFACQFCQNWHMSTFRQISDPEKLGQELSPAQIIKICLENDIKMIAATYNEPTIFFEYALDTFKLAKQNDIKTVFVSNGYGSKLLRQEIDGYLDAINIDLKSLDNKFYETVVGAKLKPVLENIEYLASNKNIWLEITTLIIPGYNDSKEELMQIAKFIEGLSNDIPWHISSFHPTYKMKDVDITSSQKLMEAYSIAKDCGIKYVYVGNTYLDGTYNTNCPECGLLLINREGMYAKIVGVEKGKCQGCGFNIQGVWN